MCNALDFASGVREGRGRIAAEADTTGSCKGQHGFVGLAYLVVIGEHIIPYSMSFRTAFLGL